MAEPIDIYIGEDRVVMLDALTDPVTGNYDNAMTGLTFELRADDGKGTLLTSGPLAYVAASNGKYTAAMDGDLPLIEGNTYWLWILQTNRNVYRKVKCLAKYHGET